MDKLKKADLEQQRDSLKNQAIEYQKKASECLGAVQVVEHLIANFDWETDGGPAPTI
jgi:hypothetical protein